MPILLAAIGISSARADELSDLQANNQLLQQKVDQLAQAGFGAGLPSRVFSEDERAAVAAAVQGSFPRSFLIPGTDTSIRIGGNITIIADELLEGGAANGSPVSTTLGANGGVNAIGVGASNNAKGASNFFMSPRQSQLTIETRTPTPYGEARTFMSFDWAGSTNFIPSGSDPAASSDNLAPRLKYAYGTLGGWLVGQANPNFADPDANGETLDFGGNVGEPGRVRVTQIRYTQPLAWSWGGALSFSAASPDTEVITPGGIIGTDSGFASAAGATAPGFPTATTTGFPVAFTQTCGGDTAASAAGASQSCALGANPSKANAPDLDMALYIPQPWGHVDIAGIIRPGEELSDGALLSKQFVGGGGAFSFDVKPGWFTPKDDIIFHIVGGTGMGAEINNSGNAAIETNFLSTTTVAGGAHPIGALSARLVTSVGGEIGYQHWWADNLRSNINGGINKINYSSDILGPVESAAANKEVKTAHANLIWNPVSFVTVGIEYFWGERTVVAVPLGPKSNQEQAIVGKFDVAF
jgi:hypothetical protein